MEGSRLDLWRERKEQAKLLDDYFGCSGWDERKEDEDNG